MAMPKGVLVVVAATAGLFALTIPATAARPRATATTEMPACGPIWTSAPAAPDASGGSSELLGVTRTLGGTAWAVGDTVQGGIAIIERLTRSGWVRVPAHFPGDTTRSPRSGLTTSGPSGPGTSSVTR